MTRIAYLTALAALAIGLAVPAAAFAQLEEPLAPTAAFTATPLSGKTPLQVTFTNESTVLPGATYAWDFGDGTTSTDEVPLPHDYDVAGTYIVTLVATDLRGDSEPATATITVADNVPPTAGFASDAGDEPREFDFTNTSTDEDGTVDEWSWDFGDGATSTEQNPSHTYDDPGEYTVSLTVTDDNGATAGTTGLLVVTNADPVASFTSAAGDDPREFDFTDTSTDDDGDIDEWSWDFGDSSPTSDEQNPSHTYADPGTYTVTLTVTDNDGGTDSTTGTVTVLNADPVASFTSAAGDARREFDFTDTSTDADGDVVEWEWDFDDGSPTSDEQSPSHTYSDPGTYTVTLTVTDNDGGTDTATGTVAVVHVDPNADFTHAPGAAQRQIVFTDASDDNGDGGDVESWSWDFGDGATSTAQSPSHTYANPGPYTVELTVTDDDGGTDTISKLVTIGNVAPTASFTASRVAGTAPLQVDFADTSTDVDGTIATREWDFGDGSPTSSAQNPSHTYAPGTWIAKLKVTDNDNSTSAVASRTITVNARPTASFEAGSLTGPAPFEPTFTSTASDSDGSIASYAWDFGDGTSGSGASVTHRYASVGTYDVTLTVTDDDGATARSTQTVSVTLPPETFEEIPAGPTLQKVLTDLLLATPGPCSVRILTVSALVVCGGNKPSSLQLRVWAVNAAPSPVAATITGVEAVPPVGRARGSANTRSARYRARRGTIPASGSAAFVLKPPAKLRRALTTKLRRRGRVARKPEVTMRAGGFTAVTQHLVTARGKKKRR